MKSSKGLAYWGAHTCMAQVSCRSICPTHLSLGFSAATEMPRTPLAANDPALHCAESEAPETR